MSATSGLKYHIDIQAEKESKAMSLEVKRLLMQTFDKLISDGVRLTKITFTEIIPKAKHV